MSKIPRGYEAVIAMAVAGCVAIVLVRVGATADQVQQVVVALVSVAALWTVNNASDRRPPES